MRELNYAATGRVVGKTEKQNEQCSGETVLGQPSPADAALFGTRAWAWSCKVRDAIGRAVALAFAEHVGAQGTGWPSLTRLSEMVGADPRTCRARLDDLIEGGTLADTGRRVGRNKVRVLSVVGYSAPEWQRRKEARQQGARHGRATTARAAPTTASCATTTASCVPTNSGEPLSNKAPPATSASRPESVAEQRRQPIPDHLRAKFASITRRGMAPASTGAAPAPAMPAAGSACAVDAPATVTTESPVMPQVAVVEAAKTPVGGHVAGAGLPMADGLDEASPIGVFAESKPRKPSIDPAAGGGISTSPVPASTGAGAGEAGVLPGVRIPAAMTRDTVRGGGGAMPGTAAPPAAVLRAAQGVGGAGAGAGAVPPGIADLLDAVRRGGALPPAGPLMPLQGTRAPRRVGIVGIGAVLGGLR